MAGRTLCLRRGSSHGDAFDAALSQGGFKVEIPDDAPPQRLRMLNAGRCDFLLLSRRQPALLVQPPVVLATLLELARAVDVAVPLAVRQAVRLAG